MLHVASKQRMTTPSFLFSSENYDEGKVIEAVTNLAFRLNVMGILYKLSSEDDWCVVPTLKTFGYCFSFIRPN